MSYLLVHGGGMAASSWDRLVPLLDGTVVAPDLPGRGSRADVDITTVTLSDCADAVVAAADGLDDITLVGHSMAGVSLARVMPRLASRLHHVVFLAAVVPEDGTRVLDQIDPQVRVYVEESIAGGIYHQEREPAREILCNDLDAEQSEWVLDRIVPDSAALLAEPVDLSGLATDVHRARPLLRSRTAGEVGPAGGRGRPGPAGRPHGDGVTARRAGQDAVLHRRLLIGGGPWLRLVLSR